MDKQREKHLVSHHNMYGPSCEIFGADNRKDFEVYCHKEHKICVPQGCSDCKYFGGDEMGKGVCCIWEESYEDVRGDEYVVQHDEVYFEFQRAENPDVYKAMMKMIEEGDLDLCQAWLGLD